MLVMIRAAQISGSELIRSGLCHCFFFFTLLSLLFDMNSKLPILNPMALSQALCLTNNRVFSLYGFLWWWLVLCGYYMIILCMRAT